MRAHIITDGVVKNTIVVNSLDEIAGGVDAALGGIIGDFWDGQTFKSPAPPPKNAAQVRAEVLTQLDAGDRKIIRAVLEGDTMRIDAWKSKAAELRSQL